MNRFMIFGAAILFIVLAWVGAWLFAASQIHQTYETAKADAAKDGIDFTCENFQVSGLPFRFDIFCKSFTLTSQDTLVEVPSISLSVRIYAPTHAVIFADSPLQIQDAFSGSKRRVEWNDLTISARTNGFALARISAQGSNFRLIDTLVGDLILGEASFAEFHVLDAPETYDANSRTTTWAVFSRVADATWSQLGIANAQLRFEADLPSMPDDLRQIGIAALAKNWAEPNPKIQLHVLEGQDEKSSFSIMGNLGVDENAAWQGDFDLVTQGLDQRLAALTSPLALSLYLGDPTEDDKLYRAYSLRHGVLFAGNVPLTALPPLL